MRLVGRPLEVYQYLEPLYNDYRKVGGAKLPAQHQPCRLQRSSGLWASAFSSKKWPAQRRVAVAAGQGHRRTHAAMPSAVCRP